MQSADLSRAAYLGARLDEVNRALALIARGGGLRGLEVTGPIGEAGENIDERVSVVFETPLPAQDAVAPLEASKALLESELASLGVAI